MQNRSDYVFTSESVGEGHPDKICDQVSDTVLDAALTIDPEAHVACEVFTTTGLVMVGGEITLRRGYIDIQSIARGVLKKIGYDDPSYGIDYQSCAVVSTIHDQSGDIAQGVNGTGLFHELGAGDQGMMFGYATNETPALMPAPVQYANQIMLRASEVRKNGILPFMRPDGKCQVTVEYRGGKPHRILTVVLSHQHSEDVAYNDLREAYTEVIIKQCLPPELLQGDVKYLINPTGRFVIGGPHGDAGLTGRKIICDTYGGMARHGGGAFSGKDPTKVDRSAAYMARYAAKNVVAAGIADKCEVQVAYAIGVAEPVSLYVTTFGTGKVAEDRIEKVLPQIFDFRPAEIIKALDLRRPVYQATATFGHFGRDQFTWERTDRAADLKRLLA